MPDGGTIPSEAVQPTPEPSATSFPSQTEAVAPQQQAETQEFRNPNTFVDPSSDVVSRHNETQSALKKVLQKLGLEKLAEQQKVKPQ